MWLKPNCLMISNNPSLKAGVGKYHKRLTSVDGILINYFFLAKYSASIGGGTGSGTLLLMGFIVRR